MQPRSHDPRMDSMFKNDRFWASSAVLVLWALYAFVLFEIRPLITDTNILLALAISGGLVLLFNTSSIVAMISHYAEDKENIYGLDLHYLDLMNNKKD